MCMVHAYNNHSTPLQWNPNQLFNVLLPSSTSQWVTSHHMHILRDQSNPYT